MTLISGIVLLLLILTVFAYSLPKNGRTARFVGTEWEGYIVVAMAVIFGVSVMLIVGGVVEMVGRL